MFILMKSWTNLKVSHDGSKTWSLGQILEKPCVCSRGHIFSLIIMKFGWNVCLDEILNDFENRSCQVRSGQLIEKPCVRCRGHIFSPIIMKHGQNVCIDDISHEFENGSCQVKNQVTRSKCWKTLCTH